ncbi:patatin-like phospholipase family protein [Sulfurovum sp. zt1-1]|uniref:Patatin-like phospholipase family protein n=1 Tax=Sulfurovum zhangzhouensis TaxID=3019067 RepID=A0ABT7QXJ9_9BACT|nr:patatin-like phospholipase family protein [Sulfurovum zhangzhouensis]MDM5271556.1 patatin-like phospholipase family protein [Sulfurovum zhangzhouensis]
MKNNLQNTPFSLVLAGGGALGIAHLGVLHDLEIKGIKPQEIIGTSMGGIIGACAAIGLSEAAIYEHISNFSGLLNWVKFSWSGNAVVSNDKIERIFANIFGDKKMCDTTIPLKLIATNLHTGEKRVFNRSDNVLIKDALLCTMAIPGIFDEHIISDTAYADGFLCENLGLNEATYETILAVDVLGKNSFDHDLPDNFFKTNNVLEMFEKSMRLLIYNQTQSNLKKLEKNIILLEPNTKKYKTYHFHKTLEIRALGIGLL